MAEKNGKTDDVAEEPQATTEPESNGDVAVEEPDASTEEKSDPEPEVAAEEKPESEPEEEETQTEDEPEPEPAPEPKVVQSGSSTDLIVQQKGDGWIVRNDGSDEIIERFDTRADAFRHARKLTSSQGGEVYVLVS